MSLRPPGLRRSRSHRGSRASLINRLSCTVPEFDDDNYEIYLGLYISDIRQQLNEQMKCLDQRLETQVSQVLEIQDFFRRRSELEMEYSKGLDRLVRNIMVKHKADKQRRENWHLYSTYICWHNLLAISRKQSRDHQVMSEIYGNQMVNRLNDVSEDVQRIYKKCREISTESHDEILKVLNELQSAMKTYQQYQAEAKQAESKLRNTESQKHKVEQQMGKGGSSRKIKQIERQVEKKQAKYTENKMKALKARNEYLLCVDGANASMQKYFVDDLADLIDCLDFGYHNSIQRTMMMHLSIEEAIKKSRQETMDLMNKCVTDVDARIDKQRFLENNSTIFSLPRKFEFQPYRSDEICQVSAQKSVQDDLIARYKQLTDRLSELKLKNDETWKSIETADRSLMDMINVKDYDVSALFMEQKGPPPSPSEINKRKGRRQETEAYYLEKFREFTLAHNKIARLEAKHNSLKAALGEDNLTGNSRPPSVPPKPKKRRVIGKPPVVGRPKLFGGSLEEYIEVASEEIPTVVSSCIRILNLYGMHHQGVFRVPGSQGDVNEFKKEFEKGEDPLVDMADSNSINSVAGVLKLYFRELREPVFPSQMFDALIDCTTGGGGQQTENVIQIKELILTLPRPIIIVLRYLFAFLIHLSEFSDENMMDAFNIAVCFGPTLLPIPTDKDQVQYQGCVNDLIRTIIVHQEDIFPNDGGSVYERMISGGIDQPDLDQSDDEGAQSEDEPDVQEAEAVFDYIGRSDRELSFKKGDMLVVYSQASNDWWDGAFKGKEGLVPDNYIKLKNRDGTLGKTSDDTSKQDLSSRSKSEANSPDVETKAIEKTLSQPNIAVDSTSSHGIEEKSTISTSTPMLTIVADKIASSALPDPVLEDVFGETEIDEVDETKKVVEPAVSMEDLELDIDNALKEVMSGLQSLDSSRQEQVTRERRQSNRRLYNRQGSGDRTDGVVIRNPGVSSNPKHTPDLVLDLPPDTTGASPPHSDPDSPQLSAAERFANNDTSTIKKASSMPRSYTMGEAFKLHALSDPTSAIGVKRSASTNATMSAKEVGTQAVHANSPGPASPSGISRPTIPPKIKPKPPMVMKKPLRTPAPVLGPASETIKESPESPADESPGSKTTKTPTAL